MKYLNEHGGAFLKKLKTLPDDTRDQYAGVFAADDEFKKAAKLKHGEISVPVFVKQLAEQFGRLKDEHRIVLVIYVIERMSSDLEQTVWPKGMPDSVQPFEKPFVEFVNGLTEARRSVLYTTAVMLHFAKHKCFSKPNPNKLTTKQLRIRETMKRLVAGHRVAKRKKRRVEEEPAGGGPVTSVPDDELLDMDISEFPIDEIPSGGEKTNYDSGASFEELNFETAEEAAEEAAVPETDEPAAEANEQPTVEQPTEADTAETDNTDVPEAAETDKSAEADTAVSTQNPTAMEVVETDTDAVVPEAVPTVKSVKELMQNNKTALLELCQYYGIADKDCKDPKTRKYLNKKVLVKLIHKAMNKKTKATC